MAANQKITLYYHPFSTAAQKAQIALEEKKVKHELFPVDFLKKATNTEPWFMRLNPACVVPVLKLGDKVLLESELIVNYVDQNFPGDLRLVPDESSEEGKEVARWRQLLRSETPVGTLTFGTMANPELSVTGLQVPGLAFSSKQELMANTEASIQRCEQYAKENPDLAEAYAPRLGPRRKMIATISDKDNALKAYETTELVMDKLEQKLTEVNADPSSGRWLCGGGFSAADITLAVILNRLDFLGIAARYHSNQKRPRLHAYWMQARQRPSIYKCCVDVEDELRKHTGAA